MRLATACLLLLLSTTNNTNNTPLVSGFQFNPLNHISTRNTNNQNVGTPQISSTTTTTTIITSLQPNTITTSTSLAAKNSDSNDEDKKKGRPKPPPRRSPTKDIKEAYMAANDLVRYIVCIVYCVIIVFMRCLICLCGVYFWVGGVGGCLVSPYIYIYIFNVLLTSYVPPISHFTSYPHARYRTKNHQTRYTISNKKMLN